MAMTAAVAARTKPLDPAAAERTTFVSSPIPLAFPSNRSAVAPAQTYLSPESIARREHQSTCYPKLLAVNQSHRFVPVVPILSCALCVDRQSGFRTSFTSAQYSDYSGEARKVKLSAPFRPEWAAMWQLGNIRKGAIKATLASKRARRGQAVQAANPKGSRRRRFWSSDDKRRMGTGGPAERLGNVSAIIVKYPMTNLHDPRRDMKCGLLG